jgi:hypothetical protein
MKPAVAVLFSLWNARKRASGLTDRLRGAFGTHQFIRELAMRSASALPDHYPTYAQFLQSHTHPICKALQYVIDGDGVSALSALRITSSTVMSGLPVLQHHMRCHSRARCLASSSWKSRKSDPTASAGGSIVASSHDVIGRHRRERRLRAVNRARRPSAGRRE